MIVSHFCKVANIQTQNENNTSFKIRTTVTKKINNQWHCVKAEGSLITGWLAFVTHLTFPTVYDKNNINSGKMCVMHENLQTTLISHFNFCEVCNQK